MRNIFQYSKMWHKMCQAIKGSDNKTYECVAQQYIAWMKGWA